MHTADTSDGALAADGAPPGHEPSGPSHPAGLTWDAIVTGRHLGLTAIQHLGHKAGSVLVDPDGLHCCFFVRAGTARRWSVATTTALGKGHHVAFPDPSKERPPGIYWLPRLTDPQPRLTPAAALRTALQRGLQTTSPAETWLASAAADSVSVAALWEQRSLAPLPAGVLWDVLEGPLGLATMTKGRLQESGVLAGPMLAGGAEGLAWWLIPVGSGDRFAGIDAVTVHTDGWPLNSPQPGRYAGDRTWLIPPQPDRPQLTDPDALHLAIEAALPRWKKGRPPN
jgi:catechol 2,3-dioxygenase-like lactoylglutathione lyase family enzyme